MEAGKENSWIVLIGRAVSGVPRWGGLALRLARTLGAFLAARSACLSIPRCFDSRGWLRGSGYAVPVYYVTSTALLTVFSPERPHRSFAVYQTTADKI